MNYIDFYHQLNKKICPYCQDKLVYFEHDDQSYFCLKNNHIKSWSDGESEELSGFRLFTKPNIRWYINEKYFELTTFPLITEIPLSVIDIFQCSFTQLQNKIDTYLNFR